MFGAEYDVDVIFGQGLAHADKGYSAPSGLKLLFVISTGLHPVL
jgi:hypothetical protein